MNARKIRKVAGDHAGCPQCGNTEVTVRTYSDTVDFRGLELDVEGLKDSKCPSCSFSWVSDSQKQYNNETIRETYARIRDKLRSAHGLLSGAEIARIRTELGLNQREAASLFGGGYNAFNKYESGEVLQSFAMDRLLRLSRVIGRSVVDFLRDVEAPPQFYIRTFARTFTMIAQFEKRENEMRFYLASPQPSSESTVSLQLREDKYQHLRVEALQ